MHSVLPRPLKGLRIPGPRSVGAFLVRYLATVAFAIWFGGFTFYSAVVVPDLHEALGGMETGEISRRVSLLLNAIGGAAVTLCWLRIALDRGARSGWRGARNSTTSANPLPNVTANASSSANSRHAGSLCTGGITRRWRYKF